MDPPYGINHQRPRLHLGSTSDFQLRFPASCFHEVLSLQIVYCVLYKLVHTEPSLVRVRAGDYEKGTVPPRLGTVALAFECRLLNMKILPSKIVRSTFSLITSRALSVTNIVVIFEAIPTNDFKNA